MTGQRAGSRAGTWAGHRACPRAGPAADLPDDWQDRDLAGMYREYYRHCREARRAKRLRGGTLFSGIGAPECAMGWVDWRWAAEIDPFASAVHAARFPHIPNLGDVTRIDPDAVEPVDLVFFGSPCQSFSVAGKRLGLDDDRGNLALVALRLIGRIRPRWVVFENVPGLLSSDGGRDFGAFLGLLGECGYGFAYRVLDAQHFGVPQRRRRVFVVGYLGDWRPPAAVLFEPESLRGDSEPCREAGENAAAGAGDGTAFSVRPGSHGAVWRGDGVDNLAATTLRAQDGARGVDSDCTDTLIAFGGNRISGPIEVATAVNAHGGPHGRCDFETETFVCGHFEQNSMAGRGTLGWDDGDAPLRPVKPQGDHQMLVTHTLRAESFDAGEDGTGRGMPLRSEGIGGTSGVAVAFQSSQSGVRLGDQHPTLDSNNGSRRHHGVLAYSIAPGMSVRRLRPMETEKLQGFPPGWTAIQYRGKPAADGPRYRAIGNSMAVPVVRWLGLRIAAFMEARP